jgi:hypothetical protein
MPVVLIAATIGGVRFLGLEGLTPAGIFPGGSKWAGSESLNSCPVFSGVFSHTKI